MSILRSTHPLATLVKRVSDKFGGDSPQWLEDYIKECLITNKDCIREAIACFCDLSSGFESGSLKSLKIGFNGDRRWKRISGSFKTLFVVDN